MIVQTDESSNAAWKWPVTVQKRMMPEPLAINSESFTTPAARNRHAGNNQI